MPMNKEEFNELYQEYAAALLGYLRKLTGSLEVAQDLLQELFIILYRRFDDLLIHNVRSYFFSMAYRLYAKWVSEEKKKGPQSNMTSIVRQIPVKILQRKLNGKCYEIIY